MRALVLVGTVTDDGHKSAALIEIGACRIALAEVYAHAVQAEKLVAFSCKRRGFCPSCGARRMTETAVIERSRAI